MASGVPAREGAEAPSVTVPVLSILHTQIVLAPDSQSTWSLRSEAVAIPRGVQPGKGP